MPDIETLARRCYQAYVDKDRRAIEALVGEPFSFTSPYDDHIDRATYFARCWPNADRVRDIRIRTLLADGEQAMVAYEFDPKEGQPFHNASGSGSRTASWSRSRCSSARSAGSSRSPDGRGRTGASA